MTSDLKNILGYLLYIRLFCRGMNKPGELRDDLDFLFNIFFRPKNYNGYTLSEDVVKQTVHSIGRFQRKKIREQEQELEYKNKEVNSDIFDNPKFKYNEETKKYNIKKHKNLNRTYILNKKTTVSQRKKFRKELEEFDPSEELERFFHYKKEIFSKFKKKEMMSSYGRFEKIIRMMTWMIEGSECSVEYIKLHKNKIKTFEETMKFKRDLIKYRKIVKEMRDCKMIENDGLNNEIIKEIEKGRLLPYAIKEKLYNYFKISPKLNEWSRIIKSKEDVDEKEEVNITRKEVYKYFRINLVNLLKIKGNFYIERESILEDIRKRIKEKIEEESSVDYENYVNMNYMIVFLEELFDLYRDGNIKEDNLNNLIYEQEVSDKYDIEKVFDPVTRSNEEYNTRNNEESKKEDEIITIEKLIGDINNKERKLNQLNKEDMRVYEFFVNSFITRIIEGKSILSKASKAYSNYIGNRAFKLAREISKKNIISEESIFGPINDRIEFDEANNIKIMLRIYHSNIIFITIVFEIKYLLNDCKNIYEFNRIKNYLLTKIEKLDSLYFKFGLLELFKSTILNYNGFNLESYKLYFIGRFNNLFLKYMEYQRNLLWDIDVKGVALKYYDTEFTDTSKLLYEEIELIIFCHFKNTISLSQSNRLVNQKLYTTYYNDCKNLYLFMNIHKISEFPLLIENYSSYINIDYYNPEKKIILDDPISFSIMFGFIFSLLTFFIYKYFFR